MFPIYIKYKKIHSEAKEPNKAHDLDAGYDLYTVDGGIIPAGSQALIPIGLAFEMDWNNPPPHAPQLEWNRPILFLQLFAKSGLATKNGLFIMCGTIDAPYRGQVHVALGNFSNTAYRYKAGDKICQMVPLVSPIVSEWLHVDRLSDTNRGSSGFGSTGK